jgi:hypothetical protein
MDQGSESMMRDGFYAGWRGREYEASPDGDQIRLYAGGPEDGFAEAAPGRYVRVATPQEIDHFAYVKTWCTWRGHPFQVLGEHEDWVRVEYTGGRAPVAEALGLDMFDRGVYQAWAPRGELQDVREELL